MENLEPARFGAVEASRPRFKEKRHGCPTPVRAGCCLHPREHHRTEPELQPREIQGYAGRQGWEIVETYQDTSSGAKDSRPGLNSLMTDARARKFTCLLVWKLDRFGRSLVGCLTNIKTLEDYGIRFIAVTQALDTDIQNPASRFLLHVLGAAAEFERSLIRERTQASRLRYQQDYDAGKVGKTVYSRSGKNLPVGRPKRIFSRERVIELRRKGLASGPLPIT
jgi:putative DNA-invertase from lambdoid prophage Rac